MAQPAYIPGRLFTYLDGDCRGCAADISDNIAAYAEKEKIKLRMKRHVGPD